MTARIGSQLRAARKTLKAMRDRDLLADADEALVAVVVGLAKAIDDDPDAKAALWKEYRESLIVLREAGAANDSDDDAAVLELVQTPLRAEVGDSS